MSAATLPKPKRLFALVDVNNMYVSRERVFNPCLQGKPVVVLSNNDGSAVARSAEVKALSVKMGEPWFKLKDLAKKHGIVEFVSDYTLYGDMSNRIMTVLRDYSLHIEVYSIDGSFLNLKAWAACGPLLPPWSNRYASVCGNGSMCLYALVSGRLKHWQSLRIALPRNVLLSKADASFPRCRKKRSPPSFPQSTSAKSGVLASEFLHTFMPPESIRPPDFPTHRQRGYDHSSRLSWSVPVTSLMACHASHCKK